MEKPKPPSPLRVLTRPSSAATTTATSSSFASSITTSATSSSSSTNPLDLPLSFLIHPSSNSSTASSSSTLPSSSTTLSSFSQPRTSDGGVVVVGFIGRRQDDVTQLMNRILDCNVFGSGNLDQSFPTTHQSQRNPEVEDWFRSRKIRYYYEQEKEIVFLQFVSTRCPIKKKFSSDSSLGLDSMLEEQDFGDLQGMLLMFSVCHVIIYLQEGSHFDTQILRKFRLLQAAKHALVPFMKSHIKPTPNSRVSTSSTSQPNVSVTSSSTSSPGRGGRIINRPSSAISLMSGLGSYSSLFPGQCTPVVLFVFLDDFPEGTSQGSNVEDSAEAAPLNQSLNLSSVPRPGLPLKASSSVVVLSRPVSKSEGDFRKKLQSSLEAQIRFLIKKCRTLAGSDVSHAGSRPGGTSGLSPLFSLEATKAVALLDRFSNRKGESLAYALGLLDEILNGKATPDTLLLESHCQGGHKEDMQSIKEFIYKQTDTLRGRGGLVTNTNGGSAAGVGMVAVAAAAAAASAASGKPLSTPELPSLDNWLSSSRLILDALLSVRSGCPDESEITQISKRKPVRGNAVSIQVEKIVPGGVDPLQSAISWLDSGKDLNMKFSTSWCQRALPAAKELYLKDLPSCYPTFLHEAQLEKALCAFRSSVKGPAVQSCIKKLEDECTSIWRSGRQLCDAVSLTGKPCAHQRHNIEVDEIVSGAEVKPHSSGFVFLHACSCGRLRRLRDDPFDFETANITFNCFDDCDKLLPALQLPEVSIPGPIKAASWSLRRVGGARYYEPSKGLLQSGFCPTEKFLVKWTILLKMQTQECNSTEGTVQEGFEIRPNQDSKVESVAAEEITQAGAALSYPGEVPIGGLEKQRISLENISSDGRKFNSGRVIPHFTMKKPFSEVVAGSLATDAAFPPVRQRKQHTETSEKSMKHRVVGDRSDEQFRLTRDYEGSQKLEDISSVQEISNEVEANSQTDSNPFLQIASNVVPVSMNVGGKSKSNTALKRVIVYFGFEHECSYGHRFLLTSEHLNELGSLYTLPEESLIQSSTDKNAAEMLNLSKDLAHEKVYPHANAAINNSVNKVIMPTRSNQIATSSSQHWDRLTQFCGPGKEHNQSSSRLSASQSVEGLEEVLQCTTLDDDGHAFSLLNRHLPIYMNCPHCKISNNKKRHQEFKFASTVSQLQRIFLVTPSFPVVLETCPVVQFEASCLPPSVPDCERQSQFSIGCPAVLPPDSFITLRLPFVYGVQLEDGSPHPLRHLEHQPELTAWIAKGTVLQLQTVSTAPFSLVNRVKQNLLEEFSGSNSEKYNSIPWRISIGKLYNLQIRDTVDEYCSAASEGGLQYKETLLNQVYSGGLFNSTFFYRFLRGSK